jgi:CCR4-NOT transcription complex subunit 7/8
VPFLCGWQDSGYDFGYLLKILTSEPLPNHEQAFFDALLVWFPNIYDIKHIVRSVKTLRGGLQEIAESIGVRPACCRMLIRQVQRIGPQHQAGSDSLLTAAVFFRIRTTYFDGSLDDDYYKWAWECLAETSADGRNYLYGFSCGKHGKSTPPPRDIIDANPY